MRYLSLVFASMLLVGCAQSTDVESAVEEEITQSDQQSIEQEVGSAEEPIEEEAPVDIESEQEPAEQAPAEQPAEPQTGTNQSEPAEPTEQPATEEQVAEEPAAEEEAPVEEEVVEEPEAEEVSEPTGFTIADVQSNDSASSCWAAINGNVYDLTDWISQHPGGSSRIINLCGTDASSTFNGMHGGQSGPESALARYLLGPLS